ncbi:MAG TPA: hypothetical protein VLC92_06275 [Rhodocyclaceae bacterium]|nr:hypothetical protein [Rhodocyclaceae bacterium]
MQIKKVLLCSAMFGLLASTASAEVVIAAGAKSPLAGVSKAQVADVFLGKTKSVGGNPAKPLDYAGSPKDEFASAIVGKSSDQLKAHYAKLQFTGLGGAPKEVSSLAEAKKAANEDPSVLIYLEKSQLDASLKVVTP